MDGAKCEGHRRKDKYLLHDDMTTSLGQQGFGRHSLLAQHSLKATNAPTLSANRQAALVDVDLFADILKSPHLSL